MFALFHEVDCKWNDWTDYGPCNTTCGIGWQSRKRSKKTIERFGGKCDGQNMCYGNCTAEILMDCVGSCLGIQRYKNQNNKSTLSRLYPKIDV